MLSFADVVLVCIYSSQLREAAEGDFSGAMMDEEDARPLHVCLGSQVGLCRPMDQVWMGLEALLGLRAQLPTTLCWKGHWWGSPHALHTRVGSSPGGGAAAGRLEGQGLPACGW